MKILLQNHIQNDFVTIFSSYFATALRKNNVATGKENCAIKMKPFTGCHYDRCLYSLKPKLHRPPIESSNLKKIAQSKLPCSLLRRNVYNFKKKINIAVTSGGETSFS